MFFDFSVVILGFQKTAKYFSVVILGFQKIAKYFSVVILGFQKMAKYFSVVILGFQKIVNLLSKRRGTTTATTTTVFVNIVFEKMLKFIGFYSVFSILPKLRF